MTVVPRESWESQVQLKQREAAVWVVLSSPVITGGRCGCPGYILLQGEQVCSCLVAYLTNKTAARYVA